MSATAGLLAGGYLLDALFAGGLGYAVGYRTGQRVAPPAPGSVEMRDPRRRGWHRRIRRR